MRDANRKAMFAKQNKITNIGEYKKERVKIVWEPSKNDSAHLTQIFIPSRQQTIWVPKKKVKKIKINSNIPKNPYRKEGITDKEFKREIIADRKYRKREYGDYHIMR